MILDNSGIDYSRMLFVFGFLFYWKIERNSRTSGKTGLRMVWFTTWLQSGHIRLQSCQKNKMLCQKQQFLRFYYNQ